MIQLFFLKSLHIPITLFQCRNFGLGTLTLPADVRGWCSSRRRLTAYTHKRNPKQQDGRNSSCEQTTRTALSIVQGKSYQLIRACDIIKCFTPVFSFSFLDIDVPITTACVQMFKPQKAAILLPSATNTSSKHNETKHQGSYTFFSFACQSFLCILFTKKQIWKSKNTSSLLCERRPYPGRC